MENFSDFLKISKAIGQAFHEFWWIILPVAFYYLFKILWVDLVQVTWLKSLQWTTLEVIPPKDLERGPKPMEAIYQGLTGVLTTYHVFETYLKGYFTDFWSFELVGSGGEVHFYIRTQTKYRNLIEAQVYSQYPDAQVLEVEDYTKNFPKVVPTKHWDLWGIDIGLGMPDPYPIRTYDKFEESITGEMLDPLASFVELMGTLVPGQHLWFQVIVQPLPEEWKEKEMKLVQELAGRLKKDKSGILQDLMDVFSNLIKGLFGPVEFPKAEKKEEQPLEFRLTPIEKEVLKAVEENLGKNVFRTKMRMIYIGKKDNFNKTFVSAFFGASRQFNDLHLNYLKPKSETKTYAWHVAVERRLNYRKRKIYHRYKLRDMAGIKCILSTSELATLWHFPDMGVKTPAVTRVDSKRGVAPPNLPVQ